ncbi:MAG: COX15/CtaA family protein [Bacteroidetes bacterium]|nr:COX15/CtaA family protein [Bacteroidota bacterium]
MNDISRVRIIVWLLCGCFLIFSMVVIGGITRLTGSGLSITEWNVVMGAIPPLNEHQWNEAFEKYKQIPQFQKLNFDFTLGDFKKIFFWEYLHRLVGRMIGMVFLIPFFYFWFTKQLDRKMVRKSIFLFVLGAIQGFMGWFMVKSGLTERTSVSHYRLAIHLVAAFITFAFTLWFALELMYHEKAEASGLKKKHRLMVAALLFLAGLQVIYGAFVAGLHAGNFANTFPTMNGEWIPSGIFGMEVFWKNFFENPVTVQFIHRVTALVIVAFTVWLWFSASKNNMNRSQANAFYFLAVAVGVQFLLGVFTLLLKVPVMMASLHQVGAFFFFTTVIVLLFRFREDPF